MIDPRRWWVPIIVLLISQVIIFAIVFNRLADERDARIRGNTASLVIACHARNRIVTAEKEIIKNSTSSSASSGFPADIVERIQDPAVRDLLAAISAASQSNRGELQKAGDALTLEDCSTIERRAR